MPRATRLPSTALHDGAHRRPPERLARRFAVARDASRDPLERGETQSIDRLDLSPDCFVGHAPQMIRPVADLCSPPATESRRRRRLGVGIAELRVAAPGTRT